MHTLSSNVIGAHAILPLRVCRLAHIRYGCNPQERISSHASSPSVNSFRTFSVTEAYASSRDNLQFAVIPPRVIMIGMRGSFQTAVSACTAPTTHGADNRLDVARGASYSASPLIAQIPPESASLVVHSRHGEQPITTANILTLSLIMSTHPFHSHSHSYCIFVPHISFAVLALTSSSC